MALDHPSDHAALKSEIAALVGAIPAHDAQEAADIADTLAWIDSGAELFRQVKPDTPPKHLVSYFAVIADMSILLVEHKGAGLWLPSGGHVEPGEHPTETVRREVLEELMVPLPFAVEAPVFLTVQKTAGAEHHIDVSLWYVLHAEPGQVFDFDRDEFHSVRWFDFDDVPFDAAEPQLGRFLDKWQSRGASPRSDS